MTFTPQAIVDLMASALRKHCRDDVIVVDAGAGAGRFTFAALDSLPNAKVIAVEADRSLAQALERELRDRGVGGRVQVARADFLRWQLPSCDKPLVFLGNPPYVRHHSISVADKAWLRDLGLQHGKRYSGLSGLHMYFMLRFLLEGKPGDRLLMILPSEWLETRYGTAIKETILERCAGATLFMFSPATLVFGATMTTSLILELTLGAPTGVVKAAVVTDGAEDLPAATRALNLTTRKPADCNWLKAARCALGLERSHVADPGEIRLGDLFGIHRGQVTGMNSVWIANEESSRLVPARFLFPAVTDGRQILNLNDGALVDSDRLQRVIDLPADLSSLTEAEREGIATFLARAEACGARNGYIARHRRPWWRVGLKPPPALIMSYMARRAPRFAVNVCGARLLNIAHGLYPKAPLSEGELMRIAEELNSNSDISCGRTYAGGLTKVEPGDACQIRLSRSLIPDSARPFVRTRVMRRAGIE